MNATVTALRRAAPRRRPRLRTLLAVTALLALLGGAAYVLLWSPVLDVRAVTVTGTARLTADAVRQQAAVPPRAPLARVDTEAVAQRVSALREVADVEVRRRWPHTVAVEVRERQVAAVVPAGDRLDLVDATGVVFGSVAKRPAGVPLVRPTGRGDPADDDARRAAVRVVAALPPDLLGRLKYATATTPDDVRLELRDGRTVLWGSPGRVERKVLVLRILMQRPAVDGEEVEVFDVSAPDVPTTRS